MLRDNRIPIDGSTICHTDLQCLDSDDHLQYVKTIGKQRVILNVNSPSNNEILAYDATSRVWYNTLPSSGPSGTSGTSGSSGTSGTTPNIFVDTVSGDVYFYDNTRNKYLGVAIIQQDASRNSRSVTNQFLRGEGNTPTNLNGFVLPWNATLVAMSMSQHLNTQTWTAEVRKNGGGVAHDSLTITNQFSKYDNTKNTNFNAGERIMIYCNGTSIDFPHVTLFFRRRF